MSDVVGSIRSVTINRIPYNVAADANITEMGSKFENDGIATSGATMRKMTKRVDTREGVVLITNITERENLKAIAEATQDIAMSYTLADGSVYRTGAGWIEVENSETEEGKTTVKMFPRIKFEPFASI